MSDSIDHVGISVADFTASKAFYIAALGTLGIKVLADFEFGGDRHAGFGLTKPDFWIGDGHDARGKVHVAFTARSRADVAAFYSAALSAGGRDNGAPGIRPHYHANYFAAFVLDPDGNNVEAVCHAPA